MIRIYIEGGVISYNLKNCYRRNRTITTKKGTKLKIVVWNGYAPWSESYSLIIRSIGGEYSMNRQIDNLTDKITVELTKD